MKVLLNKNQRLNHLTLINYANKNYLQSQKINSKTGVNIGGFDKVISYGPQDIDKDFFKNNEKILSKDRGNGYWLWKPYFIKKSLEEMEIGEFLFYCDSGSYFVDAIDTLVSCLDENQDIMPFELQQKEKKWTKGDAFSLMSCNDPYYIESKQRMACFSLWKKSEFSMKFVDEWLKYGQEENIITDKMNVSGAQNDEDFVEHRHDQSIFSLLSKKYHLKAYRDPSQFGNAFINLYPDSKYQQIIVLNRQRNLSLIQKIKKLIKRNEMLYKILKKIKP